MKQYKIFDDNESHEYTVEVIEIATGPEYRLKTSMNSEWTRPGEILLAIQENDQSGDFVLSTKLGKTLDYASLVELKLLLNVIAKHNTNLSPTYHAIEVDKTFEV